MKIDVERHELAALRGAGTLLREQRPDVIVEIVGCPEALELLFGFGYRAWRIEEGGLTPLAQPGRGESANVYFSAQPEPRGLPA